MSQCQGHSGEAKEQNEHSCGQNSLQHVDLKKFPRRVHNDVGTPNIEKSELHYRECEDLESLYLIIILERKIEQKL